MLGATDKISCCIGSTGNRQAQPVFVESVDIRLEIVHDRIPRRGRLHVVLGGTDGAIVLPSGAISWG